MARPEPIEPLRCLLELAPAADPPPAAGLVPGDGDMDEPLEEVPLGGRGDPPAGLERLVGLEVLPGPELRQPAPEAVGHVLTARCRQWSPADGDGRLSRVATILVAGVDLFFRGKLDAALGRAHRLVTAESVEPPDLVIVDIARVDPDEVADAYPETPILGFTNHTDTEGLRRAKAAGFDRIVARSALAERADAIVAELVG